MGTEANNSNWKDLLVFHNLARALTSALDLDSVLNAIMEQMRLFFEPETWSLLILDEQRQDLYYAVAVGQSETNLRTVRVALGEGMAGWVALHRESLIVPDVERDPRFAQTTGERFEIRSAICMPLLSRQRTLGVIQLFNCRLETMTEYTISFLHILCDYAAIAIENARAVEKIQALTVTDDCTGLYNQRRLHLLLEEEVERCRRNRGQFSLIFIDLDHFKAVNDRYGHLAGSRVLAEVGQSFRSSLRQQDSGFRYGGDEFILLLHDTGKDEAERTALRLHRELRSRVFRIEPHLRLSVSASFGVATFPEDGRNGHQIIRAADTMMYLVKNTTRDDIAVAGRVAGKTADTLHRSSV
jgi:diguanylate cyclase (GGDEF)-like protein